MINSETKGTQSETFIPDPETVDYSKLDLRIEQRGHFFDFIFKDGSHIKTVTYMDKGILTLLFNAPKSD